MSALPAIWAALIAIAVLAYVLLDGFDLGVGILFAVEREEADRDVMINTIAPVWDGNETWLILGGGGLFAVFPLAYAVIMPAMYPLIIAMLLGLVFRGVAFEFRFRAATLPGRLWWDRAFFIGSLVAALAQGFTLGGLLQGIKVENRAYAGGWFDWLTPFSVLCAVALVVCFALQASCWLIWRTEGLLQLRSQHRARSLAVALLAFIVAVSVWTPLLKEAYMLRWFAWPNIVLLSPLPVLVALVAWAFWQGLARGREALPFFCVQAWIVLCYAGLGISIWPMMVPPSITVADAAAPPESQFFLLVGALLLLPIILTYTGFSYWVFRGKVGPGAHYH
ncbi:MAG: cytochrome d ubiquinol oxidase subunit II [Acetobacteraceae bacterium]|nr:cytochrome d ubiquinol oxidase subunit II [Acetobacteraceae bacterium]